MLFVDESHVTLPQVRGMYAGDRARKEMLVDYGFRLPSAFDNRPLNFDEFYSHINQAVFVSATPGDLELQKSAQVVEQVIRPTGLLDPEITVKPTDGQIDDLISEINLRVEKQERVLVTTLTKKMAEDLTGYLEGYGRPGAVYAPRHRHRGADGDHPGPAAGGVRRAGGHQPAAGGPGHPRSVPGGHSGCGQGGLPAQRHAA